MKVKWFGLIALVVMAAAIVGYKAKLPPTIQTAAAAVPPRVLLAAVLSEANAPGDGCAEIIHVVRAARDQGIAAQEADASSWSGLLARYHIMAFPTVLIFRRDGREIARYVGEWAETVKSIRAAIDQLKWWLPWNLPENWPRHSRLETSRRCPWPSPVAFWPA